MAAVGLTPLFSTREVLCPGRVGFRTQQSQEVLPVNIRGLIFFLFWSRAGYYFTWLITQLWLLEQMLIPNRISRQMI